MQICTCYNTDTSILLTTFTGNKSNKGNNFTQFVVIQVMELGQILGDGEAHRSLVYCSPWGCEESDITEQE